MFALAACVAFGLAIRDTAAGGELGAELAPRPIDLDAEVVVVVIERDSVPSAAELAAAETNEAAEVAEALAAFDAAAAARAANAAQAAEPLDGGRALRALLERLYGLAPEAPDAVGPRRSE